MKEYAVLGGDEWSALLCGPYTPDEGAAALHCTCRESNHISDLQSTAAKPIVMFSFGRNYACIAIFRQDFTRTLLLVYAPVI